MGKGRRNKVIKLTPAKVKYIIRAKINNISSKIIAAEMKVSVRTVNRVWGHWMKNKTPWAPKKFGRPKTTLSKSDTCLILEIHNWHTSRFNGKEVCVVLDDSSRFILSDGEFPATTAEASIDLVRTALEDYSEIRRIREVITDYGTQFFANKTDKNGESESAFRKFLDENNIKHILARIKHPQTNGKIEKWYHTYEKSRKLFDNFDKFLNWYNSIHASSVKTTTPP